MKCIKIIFGIIIASFLTACSNQKDSFVSRRYHNLAAHYNGYFNAKLKVAEGVAKLAEQHEDKYDRILKIFPYSTATKAKSVGPMMDEAIKKTSTVISRHTIIDKSGNEKPESEKWIDDNWLVYGQAQFFKHEYFAAIEAFEYIERAYKKEDTRFAASLWLAKCYIELTQYSEAEVKLDYLRNQRDLPKNLKPELAAVLADYHLQLRNYDATMPELEKAAKLATDRNTEIRYYFILAQLYQKKGVNHKAFEAYSKVIKMNPKYEMAFNAKINRARCFNVEGKNGEEIRQALLKMEKDPKNKDYLDQIYFALADLSLKEQKEEEGITWLQQSVSASMGNNNQKALSYLELGKIYYKQPNYKFAQAYYDSTMGVLADDHPDYSDILNRRNSLTKLIKNLNTITKEDSLQRLSAMSAGDQLITIDRIIADEMKQRAEKKKKEEQQQVNQIFNENPRPGLMPGNNPMMNMPGGNGFYFYNPSAVSLGANDFLRRWGNRKLEDNWRRSNKEITMTNPGEGDTEAKTEKPGEEDNDSLLIASRRKELIEAIPTGDEALKKSTNKMVEAYYNASMIYREQLDNLTASIALFEEMLRRYPDNKYKLPVYYHLYKSHGLQQNIIRSDYYKNILLTQYPESEYAMIIKNPNYGLEKLNQKSQLELFYEETYLRFLNGDYSAVIERRNQAINQFPQNVYMPKFDYLKALSIGRLQGKNNFIASLNDVIRSYPDDSIVYDAQEILDLLNDNATLTMATVTTDTTQKLFKYNSDEVHYNMVIIKNNTGLDPEVYKLRFSNYNLTQHQLDNLVASILPIDHLTKAILIKSFENKNKAMAYYQATYNSDVVYGNTNPNLYEQVVISATNYAALLRSKELNKYLDFYLSFYK